MLRRRPRDVSGFVLGLLFILFGVVLLTGGNEEIGILWLVPGAIRTITSFFFRPWTIGKGKDGPGPLDATGTGRFRATGWPPSKNPDDYR